MTRLFWTNSFTKALRKMRRRRPELLGKTEQTLRRLAEDPFDPTLRTHKLTGRLSGAWACSVAYDTRIVFDFVPLQNSTEQAILLIDVGTHDEVY